MSRTEHKLAVRKQFMPHRTEKTRERRVRGNETNAARRNGRKVTGKR